MQTRVRQNDSLSPILFNIIVDELLIKYRRVLKGYLLENKDIKLIWYADDAMLVSEDKNDLHRMLFHFENQPRSTTWKYWWQNLRS